MRFIDEKGRLFGKINIIDFLMVIFLLSLAPMFYYGKVLLQRKSTIIQVSHPTLDFEIDCRLIMVEPQDLALIKVGDKEIGNNGQVIGEILWLGQSKPYEYTLVFAQEKSLIKEHDRWLEVPAKLRVKATIFTADRVFYKDLQIRDGSTIIFKTDKYAVSAVPLFEKDTADKLLVVPATVDIYVTLKSLDDEMIKLISAGDQELDENGEVIAEILEKGNVTKNKYDIFLDANVFAIAEEYNKKQLEVRMRLKCKIVNNKKLVFKKAEINDNSLLEFTTGKYSIKGQISKISKFFVNEKKRWLRVKVKFSELFPEFEQLIQEGAVEKDSSGNKIAQIRTIIQRKPSEVLIMTKDNQFISTPYFNKKDIIAGIDFLVDDSNGRFYYKNNPVKIGKTISFETDLYDLVGTVINIETK